MLLLLQHSLRYKNIVNIIPAAFTERNFSQDIGALVSLNLANNSVGPAGAQHLAEVLPTW